MNNNKMTSKSVEAEYLDIANKNAWPLVYQKLGRECQAYPYTFTEAKKPQNKPLNRYRDVNPYDHSRIILKRCERDYINANLVRMDRANRKYILTQGPLAFTVGHFWLMVWEQDSRAILMLNKVIEKNEIKCHWYWPHGIGEAHKLVLSDVKLTVEQINEEDCNYYTTRLFKIHDMETEESREVIQFHYTTWPDFGVPSSPVAFLEFLKRVRLSGALDANVGPAVVHCSAGIGRSGTFCLVDSCLVIIENEGVNSVNIQEVLLQMRRDRMGLIQTPDQLRFSYQAVIEGAKRLDPEWKEDSKLEESIYATVAECEASEEAPPPPPPRGESLSRPPARPLPAIPASASLGNLNYSATAESSSSDEGGPPSPPARESPSPTFSASSADDEDDEPTSAPTESGETSETALRRRRTRELSERVSAMKRRARRVERWHALKRFKSEEKPQSEPCED
ncbi:tyrosine-protein phosphatase non-receptor type 61F-like isoform X2 [Pectinophora gossypiella]|uniref:tyrosine-protein phosphatase non-receptor type 61F-like isoform X2 n=1 Tax=Pectinophora gossypiella TaxID=13191 RepID=UPI00214EDACE|nr:tyrosine-protein phosphatase non-receptor type 61F-like isoform X2 [Pectinophora gossypiella]XP_049885301.1 tyrosine-protein phosphatase non-receptor type 61F-like isoform X2 [Pectinophora gossypiella]